MSVTVRRGSISVDPGETTRLPSQEIEQLTSIICKGIPDHLNNKPTLLEHFGKFGIIAKVYCSLQKQAATIHFKDHVSHDCSFISYIKNICHPKFQNVVQSDGGGISKRSWKRY